MNTFTAPIPDIPDFLSLRARLAWSYFFGDNRCCKGGWAVAHTADGCWIITDEANDLTTASVYPDDESFICWLEAVASDHLSDDPVEFLRNFVSVPELIDQSVAEAIMRII